MFDSKHVDIILVVLPNSIEPALLQCDRRFVLLCDLKKYSTKSNKRDDI